MPALESAGERLGGFAVQAGDLGAAGILGDRDQFHFVVFQQIIRQIGADRRESKMNFRPKLPLRVLQAEPERIRGCPN